MVPSLHQWFWERCCITATLSEYLICVIPYVIQYECDHDCHCCDFDFHQAVGAQAFCRQGSGGLFVALCPLKILYSGQYEIHDHLRVINAPSLSVCRHPGDGQRSTLDQQAGGVREHANQLRRLWIRVPGTLKSAGGCQCCTG